MWDEGFARYAHANGFELATVFHETGPNAEGFAALVEELRRSGSHDVIVVSIEHFSGHRAPREALLDQLHRVGAQVRSLP